MSPSVIHIVDDDAQVRAATSFLLAGQGYTTQVYADGEEFLVQARLGRGCILLDLRLGGASGLELLEEFPRRGVTLPVIMISGHGELGLAVQAMKLGAVDFLQKPYQEGELIAAIERALETAQKRQGRSEAKAAAGARLERLSPRERQILQGLLAGMSNKAIARQLDLSPRTVEMHRANMMADLGIASLPEAIRLAIDAELTPLDDGEGAPPPAPLAPAPRPRNLDRSAPVEVSPEVIDVLEGTTDCAMLLDPQWRFVYLNANARETLGLGPEKVGSLLWDAFPLAMGTKAWDLLHRAASDRQPVRFDIFSADVGKWFDVHARPAAGAGLKVFFRDITSERRASASLKMSEETLRLVLEAVGDGAWDWNIQTDEIALSPRFLERLGYQPGDLPARFQSVRDTVHRDDWPNFTARLHEHLEGRSEIFSCEYRIRRSDGSWIWNLNRGRVVAHDPVTGKPVRMVGSNSDITERKEEEARSLEAFERLSLAQKNAGAGTWDLDLKTWQVRHCPRSLAMHGFPEDHSGLLSYEEWEKRVHPDDVAATVRQLNRIIETGETYRVVFRTCHPDGSRRWILGLGAIVCDAKGEPVRLVGLNFDITKRREAQIELDRVRAELADVSRLNAMGAMAGVLAHELEQPLTAVANYIRGARHAAASPSGQEMNLDEALGAAEKSAEYASEIIRRLHERGTLDESDRKRESLSEVIGEAVQLASASLPDAPAPVVEVDPAAEVVIAERVQIEQVLLNLLRNACEALGEAGRDDPVRIEVRKSDGQALVRVGDTGTGIDDELKGRLFVPFASSKPRGMGIGLSICRAIVEAHDGRIWVEDNEPSGSVFCFTLPLAQD